jgi:NADH dehydrogenase/NADH:ubiquinone oxidoreductase subunit G
MNREMKVSIHIDGKFVIVDKNATLMDAAKMAGISIPSLCYHEGLKPYGACRLCIVEVVKDGRRRLVTSCNYPCEEGIEVFTNTDKIRKYRRIAIELLMKRCPDSPILKKIGQEMGIDITRFPLKGDSLCILCGLCVRVCEEIVLARAITLANRGVEREVSTPFLDISIDCIGCGACTYICPTGCIEMVREGEGRKLKMNGHSLPICENGYFCDRCEVDRDFVKGIKEAISAFMK